MVTGLTQNRRGILLLYDGYRSHMSYQTLSVLDSGGIIASSILAHTSGTTQPLDVAMFNPFKAQTNCNLQDMCSTEQHNIFDMFDLCKVLSDAYRLSFTSHIVA